MTNNETLVIENAKKEFLHYLKNNVYCTAEDFAFQFSQLPPQVLDDDAFVKETLQTNNFYRLLPLEVQLNHNLSKHYIALDEYHIQDIPKSLLLNQDFVKSILSSDYSHYSYVDDSLKTETFIVEVLKINHECYSLLSKEERENPVFLDVVIKNHPNSLFFASPELQNDYHYQSLAFNNPKHKNAPYGYVNNEYEDWLELFVPVFLIKKEEQWLQENMPQNPTKHKAKRF